MAGDLGDAVAKLRPIYGMEAIDGVRHGLEHVGEEPLDEEGELVGGLLLGEQQKLEKQRARSLSRVD